MGAQINLFYKFTRKPEIGVEEVFVGWCDREAGGGVPRSRDALSRGFGMLDF
jgi:hypothetical protein